MASPLWTAYPTPCRLIPSRLPKSARQIPNFHTAQKPKGSIHHGKLLFQLNKLVGSPSPRTEKNPRFDIPLATDLSEIRAEQNFIDIFFSPD
jgi:hypothetical protein